MNEDTTNASFDYARLFAAIRLMVEALQVAHQCISNPWCNAATREHALKAIEAAMTSLVDKEEE
jgi:hypothetical protein